MPDLNSPRAGGRQSWIDAAKGLGIVLVVAGHVWPTASVTRLIYAFHMPLFFILSGYMFKSRHPRIVFERQLLSLGVPYVVFLSLIWGVVCLTGRPDVYEGWRAIKLIVGGSYLEGPFTAFWFVSCLFVARVVFALLTKHYPDPAQKAWWGIAVLFLVYAVAQSFFVRVSPLGLLAVPVAIFYLWAGQFLSRRTFSLTLSLPLALVALLLAWWQGGLNMKDAQYGVPLLSLLGAIPICMTVFALSRWLGLFAPFGRASITIMFLHAPVIFYGLPHLPLWLLFLIALLLPFAAHLLFSRWSSTRLLFLGSRQNSG